MNRITFAEPLFLYLLAVVPVMIAFYMFKQQKATASFRCRDFSHLKIQFQLSDIISGIFCLLSGQCA